jgi:hypothetical protein
MVRKEKAMKEDKQLKASDARIPELRVKFLIEFSNK